MSPPPAKRQRTDVPTKHSDLWFSDGSVVLQAVNTQFRVHWSLLARHSSVFRDMQGLPQPSDEPSVDGCPVVQLQDDPTEVEFLLSALYDPVFLAKKTLSLEAVGAFIRLGRKYDFRVFLESAVARITSHYPATLEEYDIVKNSDRHTAAIKQYAGIEIDMLTLVSENNIMSALPFACYRALHPWKNIGDLFDGTLREDGTRAFLSQNDLRRCTIGHEKLSRQQFEPGYTFGWTRQLEVHGCATPVWCRSVREEILSHYMDRYLIYALVGQCSKSSKLCTVCRVHAKDCMNAGRKKIWEELPQIFDLPPWVELENDL